MKFSYGMTIGELVVEMNNGGSQSTLYAASREAGKAIPKDIIPYVFKAAAYDYEKNMYKATSQTDESMTIENLLPLARQLQKQAKIEKLNKDIVAIPTVIENGKEPIKEIIESNPLQNELTLANQSEAQAFILEALDLTLDELSFIKELAKNKVTTNGIESIYESIKQLGGRERLNKTYYISKEVIEMAAEFCEEKSVKVSQFVEVAILEAIKKYK
ncbi:hypothetical protein [Lysinibacillus boronitolerans]|uniref:hypothetical protein n=1 Tax=Lysinibacillus boronitolerans TaxID=309788 RepID=UPI0002DBD861|nr:hypothetical protein [Lysinibacillus boronitolerans]